jgi:hypothetical protein
MDDYWAEGNSNKAVRNFYKSLDEKKMACVLEIVKTFGSVDSMDNDMGVYFHGFFIDYEQAKDCVNMEKWNTFNKIQSEQAPYLLRTASFESMIMYLLKQDMKTLKALEKVRKKCKDGDRKSCDASIAPKPNKSTCQKGGSDEKTVGQQFMSINTSNTKLVVSILKMFDKTSGDYSYEDLDTEICFYLADELSQFFELEEMKFKYSARVKALDIWYIVMFLYQCSKDQLQAFIDKHNNIKKYLDKKQFEQVYALRKSTFKNQVANVGNVTNAKKNVTKNAVKNVGNQS